MSKPDLSVIGGRTLGLGYAGQVATSGPTQIISRTNEGATAIDFGVLVVRGTIGNGTCKAMAADADPQLGISVRNPEKPASTDGNNTVNYPQYSSVSIMTDGEIFAKAAEDVREGDQVLAITASGGTLGGSKGGVAGSGRVDVIGATWQTTTASGAIGKILIKTAGSRRTTT